MSQIDWSKAPEGATHFCGDTWYTHGNDHWHYWSPSANQWFQTPYASPENFSWWGASEAHPAATEWNGEGLPPVGTVCWYGVGTDERRIIAHIDQGEEAGYYRFLAMGQAGEMGGIVVAIADCFKPIRTPEQIATEARNKAAAEMSEATRGAKDWNEAFKMLHDKGYRLFEIVKEKDCPHSSSYNDGAALCCSFCGKG